MLKATSPKWPSWFNQKVVVVLQKEKEKNMGCPGWGWWWWENKSEIVWSSVINRFSNSTKSREHRRDDETFVYRYTCQKSWQTLHVRKSIHPVSSRITKPQLELASVITLKYLFHSIQKNTIVDIRWTHKLSPYGKERPEILMECQCITTASQDVQTNQRTFFLPTAIIPNANTSLVAPPTDLVPIQAQSISAFPIILLNAQYWNLSTVLVQSQENPSKKVSEQK